MYSGVVVLDSNRVRFRVDSWKEMVALKFLRRTLKDIMTQAFRNPGRALSTEQLRWFDVWQQMFSRKVRQGEGVSR